MTEQSYPSHDILPEASRHGRLADEKGQASTSVDPAHLASTSTDHLSALSSGQLQKDVPFRWKLASVVLVTAIGFGSHWSSGITGAMKSTMKRELHINNTQFALLEASEDFVVTVLLLASGALTDRVGGAGALLYGNTIFSVGSVLVAAAAQRRSYKFMVVARIISALGDIATQIAQFKVFSSWFAPSNGFATTLGIELGIGKLGAFAGKSSANIIAKNTGNFAWVFWIAVFMNLFTNLMTAVFCWFTKLADRKFLVTRDPATGEKLTEKNERFELRKVLELSWVFWAVQAYSLFESTTVVVFLQNCTELAEQRFSVSPVTAGWYSSILSYGGFFVVPLVGIFIDLFGNRISVLVVCVLGVFASMCLIHFTSQTGGTAASFGLFGFAYCLGFTTVIDSTRTSLWAGSGFGPAFSLKFTMNSAMDIIIRIVTGVIQDRDNNLYNNVTLVYVVLAGCAVAVSLSLLVLSWKSIDLGILQWTRKKRIANGALINERKRRFHEEKGARNRLISQTCFGLCVLLVLGSWGGYFWTVATGNRHDG